MASRSTDSVTVSAEVTADIRRLIADAGIEQDAELIARILATGIGLGLDDTSRLDLKITTAALAEMRAAFRMFAPYRGAPKVTVFGSARTRPHDALYRQASEVAAALAARGWMVVTGAGPGIMQAAAEGAGPEASIGVSIRLPFEAGPNEIVSGRNVAMKYFFTRKLMLVKESHGFVCVPGGFGTLDELFELLTLQQTGKAEPMPIVLLDADGGSFWEGLKRYVDDELVPAGVISPDDFDRVVITGSVARAAEEITDFWCNYDSVRWVGKHLVMRVRTAPTPGELDDLNAQFSSLLTSGRIEASEPLDRETADGDKLELPRLVMDYDPYRVGSLYRVIRAVNALPSAPERASM